MRISDGRKTRRNRSREVEIGAPVCYNGQNARRGGGAQMERKYGRPVWWALCAGWIAVIFAHSLMPAALSEAESYGLLARLAGLLPFLTARVLRKLAHFGEFCVLGLLLARCLPRDFSRPVLAGALCAMTDETIQLFVPGRSGEVRDVWIDLAGAALGVALTLLISRIRSRRR